MILDYNYNPWKKDLTISYITSGGGKKMIKKNVKRFKTFQLSPSGTHNNWDGSKCEVSWTEKPCTFDLKTFFEENLTVEERKFLAGKSSPKLYTFDIETEISDEFPEPSEAKFPITTISVASPDCNVIVLGTKELGEGGEDNLQKRLDKYLEKSEFFDSLGLPRPYIKYIKFSSEGAMLEYFLKNIVAKVPVLAGWNSIMFDWQYIQNRIKGYHRDLKLEWASAVESLTPKRYTDMKNNQVTLHMPNHTLIVDMMDVIGNFDMVVMPIKESLSLDYIASEKVGLGKIKYDGDLQQLFETDYSTYVFYNAIDSILVQLIDKRFKTMDNIYAQALYCKEKIGSCFSKIALAEALFFNYFYSNNIKIVPINVWDRERGTLVGAYVAKPVPGLHKWVTCNDFASLYPSIIRTTNISIENFVGAFYDEEALKPYKADRKNYIVVGGTVYKNKGTEVKPELGDEVGVFLRDDELHKYRKNKNYFVSVNGHVYKNDKDYSFKSIQSGLASDRNKSKYLAKQLDATVASDASHMLKGHAVKHNDYPENICQALSNIGWDIKSTSDLLNMGAKLSKFLEELKNEISYLSSFEQACKLLMNSLYGGSSHVAFAFFALELANDITGEARNIIHLMEDHIPKWFRDNWYTHNELHKLLGVKVRKVSDNLPVKIVAGDTDSLYLCYSELVKSIEGSDKMSIEEIRDIIINLNTKFLDGHNEDFMNEYYNSRHCSSVQKFELETLAYSECRLDVKKRYAQLLLWKDGKIYDVDSLEMKVKGLEMIKASYSKQAREALKRMVRYILEDKGEDGYLLQRVNIRLMDEKSKFYQADLEDVCGNIGVQNYTKYILDDTDPTGLKIGPKCPYNVRALGNYNWIKNVNNLPGDPLLGGKMKWYCFYPNGVKSKRKQDPDYFAFQSRNYPSWADKYAPICREAMFERMVLDPLNRIMESSNIGQLSADGSIQMGLF